MTNIIIGTTPTITYTFRTVSVSDLSKAILTLQTADGNIIENQAFQTLYEGE